MYRFCFLSLLVCNAVLCDDCVTEDFENGLETNFDMNDTGCHATAMMRIGHYSSVNVTSPHPRSTSFITLITWSSWSQRSWSCIRTKYLTLTGGGTIEVNIYGRSRHQYTASAGLSVKQHVPGRTDRPINGWTIWSNAMVHGWQTLRLLIPDTVNRFEGYITFIGNADTASGDIIIIDSFRYIAPSFNESLCVIYKETQTSTTKEPTTITTTRLPIITTTTELPITKTTATEAPPTKTASEEAITITKLPSITTAIATTEEPTTSAATTIPSTTTVTSPSTSTLTPRLAIYVQKIYIELNAKIIKYFK